MMKYQNILKIERKLPKVVWYGVATKVSLIGSFNNWKLEIPLKKCPLRNVFIRYFKGLRRGEYEIKFIVDGAYQLSS